MGIFLSNTISLIVAIFLSFFFFIKLYPKFDVLIDLKILKKIATFTIGNQIATIFLRLPSLLFPLIILSLLSAQNVAYFYIPWTIFLILCEFVMLINGAFLMEGAYEERYITKHLKKVAKLLLLVVAGGIILFSVFGEFILGLFGKDYLVSIHLLQLLGFTLIPFAINQVYLTYKNIKKEMKEFTLINILISLSALIFGTLLIFHFGTLGVVYGWMIGQLIGLGWIIIKKFIL